VLVSWGGQVGCGKVMGSIEVGSIVFNVMPLEKVKCTEL
jgi:hypothetical protein